MKITKGVPWIWAAAIGAALSGCGNSKPVDCADKGVAFFRGSLDSYYSQDERAKSNYKLVPGAEYQGGDHIWHVPFDLDSKHYLAIMKCDGGVELSVIGN